MSGQECLSAYWHAQRPVLGCEGAGGINLQVLGFRLCSYAVILSIIHFLFDPLAELVLGLENKPQARPQMYPESVLILSLQSYTFHIIYSPFS